ncbi:putative transcription factor C2H2 family [Rosa chinensis]|uniref:RING-type E3 ubiquitin transferase n=1 Tax=Rosa chinensis TaxID=74649 RepID=A0A2P6SLD3_ROSCH|nr:RING-H2 finger protein ATL66 [Rosa chinensis]PRQ59476.1 putative transcription factor C2H2 family [Rosa chinensis]
MSTKDSSGPFHGHYTVLDDKEFQVKGRTLFFVVILFTVVLLVTVFLLYARWVCRYRPSNSPFSSHAPNAPPQKPRGLDAALIRGLPIILYQSSGNSEAAGCGECSICLGVFEDGEKVKVLPQCRHCYHSDCVDTWLSAQSSCPLCRTSLRSNSDDALQIVVQ